MSATGMPESDTSPNRFSEVNELAAQARALMVASLAIQESLEHDSRAVATSVLRGDVMDIFGDEWPLTYAYVAEGVKDVVVAARRQMTGQEKSLAETPTWPLMSSKYNFGDLAEIYESDDPVTSFAVDLLDWSEQMAQRGWPMLLEIELAYMRDGGRGEVSVYADTPEARKHLEDRSNSYNAPPEEGEENQDEPSERSFPIGRGFVIDYEEAGSEQAINTELSARTLNIQ